MKDFVPEDVGWLCVERVVAFLLVRRHPAKKLWLTDLPVTLHVVLAFQLETPVIFFAHLLPLLSP